LLIENVKIDFKKGGSLVPAIIQEESTKEILMLGYMNQEAFSLTLSKKIVHFWSRSRKKLWMKGEESGNKLEVKKVVVDCDKDAVLVLVRLLGTGVCHTGAKSCFFTAVPLKQK